jgi:hypothetical protein
VTTWKEALVQADAKLICGAKAKSTCLPCRARPVPGQNRCRLHGGIVREMTPELRALLRAHAATQPRVRGRFAPRAAEWPRRAKKVTLRVDLNDVDGEV